MRTDTRLQGHQPRFGHGRRERAFAQIKIIEQEARHHPGHQHVAHIIGALEIATNAAGEPGHTKGNRHFDADHERNAGPVTQAIEPAPQRTQHHQTGYEHRFEQHRPRRHPFNPRACGHRLRHCQGHQRQPQIAQQQNAQRHTETAKIGQGWLVIWPVAALYTFHFPNKNKCFAATVSPNFK